MIKELMDNGFPMDYFQFAHLDGPQEIPKIMALDNIQIPKSLISFEKAKTTSNKRQYIHFYIYDIKFRNIPTYFKNHIDFFQQFDGIITPDPTLDMNQPKCIQETITCLNRIVGCYAQRYGIPVIPNVRFGDESSYDYCFLGIPKNSIVCISTHGAIKHNWQQVIFKKGLKRLLEVLTPTDVLVYGRMPRFIFDDYLSCTKFHRYPSEEEQVHQKCLPYII